MMQPLIGEPKHPQHPENPDFAADYIYCNYINVKFAAILPNPLIVGSHTDPGSIIIMGQDFGEGFMDYTIKPIADPLIGKNLLTFQNVPGETSTIALIPSQSTASGGGGTWFECFSHSNLTIAASTVYSDTGIRVGTRGSDPQVDYWRISNGDCDVAFRMNGDLEVTRNIKTNYAIQTGGSNGPATDADVWNPSNGMIRYDSTNNRLYVRISGVWKFAALT